MSDVKRKYTSPRREAQARQTRRSILGAAGRIFVGAGYGASSLQQVADEAGVSVQTIYATFGNKRTLLAELLDVSIAGDDEPVAVNDRDWMYVVFNDPDPVERVQGYAAAVAAIYARAGDIFTVVQAAADTDPELGPLAVATEQRRRAGATGVIKGLEDLGALRADLTTDRAVDILWTLNSPDLHRRLVRDSGWPLDDYQAWLAETMTRALLSHS